MIKSNDILLVNGEISTIMPLRMRHDIPTFDGKIQELPRHFRGLI